MSDQENIVRLMKVFLLVTFLLVNVKVLPREFTWQSFLRIGVVCHHFVKGKTGETKIWGWVVEDTVTAYEKF